ncbi:MAG TPA: hypothetical protein G4O08_11655 [Anaerolineae bacterium]|nr:hypothetical protein [Anaerolineae bacterium]
MLTPTTLSIIASVLLGRRRSFASDSAAMVARLHPPLHVEGSIPDLSGAASLVIVNHYYRPGFEAWWIPLSISSMIQSEIHWTMTSTWRFEDQPYLRWLSPLLKKLFRRIAAVYGFTNMPPMPPSIEETEQRARAVRQVLRHVVTQPEAIIGMAPEGHDSPDGRLIVPPSGVGRFVCHLAKHEMRLLPMGVYESGGRLCLHIGTPMALPLLQGTPVERDREMRDLLMKAIAECLPAHLRGAYA